MFTYAGSVKVCSQSNVLLTFLVLFVCLYSVHYGITFHICVIECLW